MKKVLTAILLVFLGSIPLACNRFMPVDPAPVGALMTPTPFGSPICGYTQVSSFPLSPVPTGTVTTYLPNPFATPSVTPIYFSVTGTPQVVTPTAYPIPFSGPTTILRTLAEFQSVFGNWVPQVDFNTQMILVGDLPEGCSLSDYINSVCEGPSQVTVDLTQEVMPITGAQCFHEGISIVPIAVPKSNLPVVWQITGP